jgi:bacteriocin biosynthesis cyclodehydratase domain-containing protein
MRPKFNTGISYIPVPEGVYLRGNDGHLLLRGSSLYPLLERLVPLLNGDTTLEELTRELDSRRRRMLIQLIEKLLAHRFVQDVSQEPLAPGVHTMDASNLAFLASLQTSPATHLARMQNLRLLVPGGGPAFTSLIQASLQCGVRQLCVLIPAEEEGAVGQQEVLRMVARRHSCGQSVRFVASPAWDDEAEVRACLQDCDAVLHIADGPQLARVQLLNRLCIAEQKTCLQAVIVGEQAWTGPLVCAQAEGCWECAWRRLQANQERTARCAGSPPVGSPCLDSPQLTMLANRLVLALFHSSTETGQVRAGETVSVLHLATGLSESHAFLPHPACQACQHAAPPEALDFQEHIRHLEHLPPVDRDSLWQRFTVAVVDPRFGLFTFQEGETFVQAPLTISTATLCAPTLAQGRPEVCTVAAVSRETEDARVQVAGDACARYAASLVDRRRLFALDRETLSPACSGAQREEQQVLGTWALDLQMQQACPVPATQAFPALDPQEQGGMRGVAWGMSWDEAVCRALLDHCNDLTVQRVKQARQSYARVALARLALPASGRHLVSLLHLTVGEELLLYDVTGSLGVPTVATCVGERVVAYTTACNEVEASDLGLLRALEQFQTGARAPVPALPLALRGSQRSVARCALPETWEARRVWLVQRLQTHGFRMLAVPLDHDRALARILPWIVRVLLWRVEPQGGECYGM